MGDHAGLPLQALVYRVSFVPDDLKIQKQALRAEAQRARGFMSLDIDAQKELCSNFFKSIDLSSSPVIAAYWPKDRELDTQVLIDECLGRGFTVCLPVIEGDERILKFAKFGHNIDLVKGRFGVCHPVLDENPEWLEPDIFFVPMLAFDRSGYRLGFGGGFYDATLAHYAAKKSIMAVGLAFAKQACLFGLPREDHDVKMDWIITERSAQKFT